MLKGIAACIGPELLKTLCEMGHGDEIVLADAYFPSHSVNARVIRMDGVQICDLLAGITPLWSFDRYATPVVMMAPVDGDTLDPAVETSFRAAMGWEGAIDRLPRDDFYARSGKAFAVVQTSDKAQYGNVILKKGNFT